MSWVWNDLIEFDCNFIYTTYKYTYVNEFKIDMKNQQCLSRDFLIKILLK